MAPRDDGRRGRPRPAERPSPGSGWSARRGYDTRRSECGQLELGRGACVCRYGLIRRGRTLRTWDAKGRKHIAVERPRCADRDPAAGPARRNASTRVVARTPDLWDPDRSPPTRYSPHSGWQRRSGAHSEPTSLAGGFPGWVGGRGGAGGGGGVWFLGGGLWGGGAWVVVGGGGGGGAPNWLAQGRAATYAGSAPGPVTEEGTPGEEPIGPGDRFVPVGLTVPFRRGGRQRELCLMCSRRPARARGAHRGVQGHSP